MLFLQICNAWTEIALYTLALWARINFIQRRPAGYEERLKLWFQRAGGRPLHISVVHPMDDDVTSIIWDHSSHLERLELSVGEKDEPESESEDEDNGIDMEFWDIWSSVQPRPLPLLQSLSIHGRANFVFESLPFVQLLRFSPNLSELILHDVDFNEDADAASEKLVLSNLRRLIVDHIPSAPADDYDILTFISAPQFRIASFTGDGVSYDSRITSFLDRSKPPGGSAGTRR
ncbi:hypothetical protein FB45DRAFT_38022 [Roridomyces roridus]|uniref:F-box domain-containing protein n=1 Tax=Roridomyces roridus TaxID=1738132 RepID=A0AAD7BRY6_9AGAR|nr:hypothetical protein FB45DRAFT_38022 [Roridomyces roridus]